MNFLYVTTISGFLPQFEKSDAALAKNLGCDLYYASDFDRPVYRYDKDLIAGLGIKECPVSIEKSPFKIQKNIKAVREISRLIDEEQIDIIHCHNAMGGVDARLAAMFSKRHPYVIYTAHGFHFFKGAPLKNKILYYNVERLLAKHTDCIVTINAEDFESAKKLPIVKKENVHYIHGVGVDSRRFFPRPDLYKKKREELCVPEGAFHLVSAAELNDNKNLAVMIKALALSDRKDIYYSICGEGGSRKKLENLIRETGTGDRIRLLGYRNDMEEVLASADAFAFPSIREGLGVAAVEALLSGVPLICSDNRGTREYARDGVNAIVCRSGSAEEYSSAVERLYSDRDYRDKLASACVSSASGFVVEETAGVMRPVYEKAMEEIRSRYGK